MILVFIILIDLKDYIPHLSLIHGHQGVICLSATRPSVSRKVEAWIMNKSF